MDDVWVEKYRPRKLSDVIGQKAIVERLHAYVRTRSMPHMLFAGPAGCGKTTSAIALAKELYGDQWRDNLIELNASDERGIDIVRGKIKDFARAASIGRENFKIIFLDEADSLTSDAQAALRRTMERYTQTCRFVLSCNYSSKIIEPIQSRCAVFRFRPLSEADVRTYLTRVSSAEGLEFTEDGLTSVISLSGGDLRKATNILQVVATLGKRIDAETVFEATENIRPAEISEMLTIALKGNFTAARAKLDEMTVRHGLSGEDIVQAIHKAVIDLPIDEETRIRLIDRVGEAEFRMVSGSSDRIQLEALLAHFAVEGKRAR
ncbi:MAG: replication factor C small subunit [Thermoplasmata archaeon]|jgi:replication factor C small subunit|nr:replication factor C small subunit [Thermoplasmata archaeon]